MLRAAAAGGRDPRVQIASGQGPAEPVRDPVSTGATWTGAEPVLREALAVHAALAADYPAVPDYRYELAKTQSNLAVLYLQNGPHGPGRGGVPGRRVHEPPAGR